jgi:hypothetical protein
MKPRCDEGCNCQRQKPKGFSAWLVGFLLGTGFGIVVAVYQLNDSLCRFEQWLLQVF